MQHEEVSSAVIGAAMRVHTRLGPGLLESAYQACLGYELRRDGHEVGSQVPVPLIYDEVRLEVGYRADLLVDGVVLVEVKAIETIHPVHHAQLLCYLRLTGYPVGLLLNFHVRRMKDGITRMVDG
jgi:GxxExxY protein